ncbi:hypothetical protein B0H66DRAFT_322724 [Apodospora peruviana]|uniref:Transport protein USO1 n=1 Tax=Apodospora peruviana TaxID=516989 RepID=A0AAE0M0Q2_9PEZI|nr:hypothetical protein B0H66DRAFT_322724 [Apodospora peruviana]
MAPIERDAPRDLDRALRHQHSASSDHSRALVPMWDSSDPERAPPPLPLNPQSPVAVSRVGTSSAIQSAHAALTEKARENALVPHMPKRMADASPERSLLRGSTHRRMQSLQPISVKDHGLMIEGSREPSSPTARSPEKNNRPSTPPRSRTSYFETKEEKDDKGLTASPQPGPSLTPIIRPVVRRLHQQSILGENTPPQSATMLALQTMSTNNSNTNTPTPKEPEVPLANITNGSTALVRVPQSLDALSNQILTLTDIATTLQKEMSQLSRRSRDNATDLLSLKEATNARDEDIRKSLRELITDAKIKPITRDPYGGPLLLEGRHHPSSPTAVSKSVRPFSLPRIPSPNSFAASLDRESLLSTPSLVGADSSPTTVALLEKILREMGTRDGQDTMLARLTEVAEKLSGMAAAEKVEELIRLVRSNQQQAVVPAAAVNGGGGMNGGGGGGGRTRGWSFEEDDDGLHRRELNYNQTGPMSARVGRLLQENEPSSSTSKAADILNDDVLKAIRTVKDSVAQGGGLTAETKALVRELRGEVLGMGREIGRRLDEVAAKGSGKPDTASKSDMTKIVEEGLAEMKQHMNNLLREHRRHSAATVTSRESSIDYKEIYNSMRAALKDSQANKPRDLRREDVLQAVKDAWERYQPDIQVQQIGLERGEVLACLQEGLREYAPRDDRPPAATREEVFKAVVEGLKHFVPPQVETPASLSRDEILDAVRECLEEFEFPVAPSAGPDISKDDMLDAVKEGLHAFEFPVPPPQPSSGSDLTRDDVLDAVNEGLHTFDFTAIHSSALAPQSFSKGEVSDAVKEGLRLLDLSTDMLDAVREGVHSLDLPRDMADAVKQGLESFDFSAVNSSALVARADLSRVDMVDAVKEGLESLHLSDDLAFTVKKELQSFDFDSAYASAITAPRSEISRVDVADAVKDGFESLDLSSEVARAVKEGFQSIDLSSVPSTALVPITPSSDEVLQRLREMKEFLRAEFEAVSEEAKQNIAANGRDTEQVLDATKDGLEKLRQDIETYVDRARGETDQEEFMNHLIRTLDSFRGEVGDLVAKSSESSREVLREEIESLRDTVNSSLVPALPQAGTGNNKDVLEALQEGLSSLRTEISTRPIAGLTEILDALQEGLGDIRSSIDKLHNKPTDLTANDEILDALKSGLDSVRSEIDELREESKNDRALAPIGDSASSNLNAIVSTEQIAKQDDIKNLEVLITQLGIKVEAMESTPPPVVESLSKEDLANMESMLHDVAETVASMPSRQPLESLEDMLRKVQDSVDEMALREQSSREPSNADAATKEDVEAIENILRNTKARLDDLIDGDQAVRKDHIDTLETLILDTRETLGGVFSHLENVSSKEDVAMVESLVTQIISSFDEMKERHEKALEDPEKVTKTDIDAIEAVCLDMKQDLAQMVKADIDSHSSKEDIRGLEALLKEFRDRIESIAEANAKQFEERQAETVGVGERVTEVKTFLTEFQDIVKGKLEDGAKGIDAMNGVLDSMGDTIRKNANVSDDLKEMFETIKVEFEESRAGVVGAKLETDERFQVTTDILTARFDERIAELMVKYDEFQLVQEDRAIKGEARDVEMEAAFVSTKAVAEELKSLVDTLGAAVTDSLEKMEEASKTVFDRVEELVNKSEENRIDGKTEHQLTRDHLQEAIGKVDGHVAEYQPKIFEAIQDVLSIVGQHYEHSRMSTEKIQEKIEDSKPPEQPLLPPPEKYDDSAVLEKLDKLVDHTQVADKAFAQFDTLDKVHAQVKQTAAELAVFIAAQTQRIADEHEDREKTLQDTIVNLERKLTERDQVEANVAILREEESRLRETINVNLREEQEKIKEQFLFTLQEEELRLRDATGSLREEQDRLKDIFVANLKDEQSRLMETNIALKEEQGFLKETFLNNLRDEEARLKEMNDALREEQQLLKDTFLSNLREEESLLKDVNANLRAEQQVLRESFLATFKEEESRLREANTALREEQEQLKATFKQEQERLRLDLLSNLLEEEARLKEANASLREEQRVMKEDFLAGLKEEEARMKDSLREMRAEQENLGCQKTRLAADLSSLDTALRLRREELHDMEARAEGLERRILEGVMDHSRVLLMAKTKRAGGRDSMSRKRVSSHSQRTSDATTPTNMIATENTKPRNAFNMALAAKSKALTPNQGSGAARRILSLSQITNNTPTGGMKRSQSVRTAGVGGGRLRKASWAPGGKGYGDLGKDMDKDKENLELKESDEEKDENVFNDAFESQAAPPPVDIVVSAPSLVADSGIGVDEEEQQNDYEMVLGDEKPDPREEVVEVDGEDDGEKGSDTETQTLRRSSRGTTVITSTESYTGSEDYSDDQYYDDDDDDARSDWTESVAGTESRLGHHDEEEGSEVSTETGEEYGDEHDNQQQLVLAGGR